VANRDTSSPTLRKRRRNAPRTEASSSTTPTLVLRRNTGLRGDGRTIGQFLRQDRHPEVGALHAFGNTNPEHLHDLLPRDAVLQGCLDVPARARRVHVRDGRVKGDAQPFTIGKGMAGRSSLLANGAPARTAWKTWPG